MIFDSHAHYDDEQFDCDREELLDSMQEHGIGGIINVGASMEGVFASQELAEKYPFIYAGVGIHPDYVGPLPTVVILTTAPPLALKKVYPIVSAISAVTRGQGKVIKIEKV